jgi:hypothetical protein
MKTNYADNWTPTRADRWRDYSLFTKLAVGFAATVLLPVAVVVAPVALFIYGFNALSDLINDQ